MLKKNLQAIVLAAGKSSRFKTGKTKLLEKICGQEMVVYATRLLQKLALPTTVVIGFQGDLVQKTIQKNCPEVSFITQEKQQGTGHAIICTRPTWHAQDLLIMNGDVPLISQKTIEELYALHTTKKATISFITAHNSDPVSTKGYGRVIETDGVLEIVEARHFNGDYSKHCCINGGIYLINKDFLSTSIDAIKKNNTSAEFYLTDIVKIASSQGLTVCTLDAPFDHIRGINTFQELWVAEHIQRSELVKYWMEQGVHFTTANNVIIDLEVVIGAGSTIGSGVHLTGKTVLGKNSTIHEFSSLKDSTLGDHSSVLPHCVIKNSTIGSHTTVGPFAHVHTNTIIGNNATIGNFVEIKNSCVRDFTKAKHLSYLGDATIGSHVNIGAGTIICNYNGFTKNSTTILDNSFVGTNNTLVAPVTIGKEAFTAAGSVITQDVPDYAMGIARSRQTNKEGYAKILKERNATSAISCAHKSTKPHCIDECCMNSDTQLSTVNHTPLAQE